VEVKGPVRAGSQLVCVYDSNMVGVHSSFPLAVYRCTFFSGLGPNWCLDSLKKRRGCVILHQNRHFCKRDRISAKGARLITRIYIPLISQEI